MAIFLHGRRIHHNARLRFAEFSVGNPEITPEAGIAGRGRNVELANADVLAQPAGKLFQSFSQGVLLWSV
jgi:hypothetical protein